MPKEHIHASEDAHGKVSFKEQVAYGLGDGATGIAGVTIASFAMYYYTDVIGVSAALLGTILFFTRFFDAITNIIMGYIVDRTNSKHGRARPWILWTMIPFGLSLILVFSASPSWDQTTILLFALVSHNIYFLVYTASNIPYGTLGALITQDPTQRNHLNILRMISYFSVMMVISAVTLPFVNWLGGEPRSWQLVMTIYAILLVIVFSVTFFFTKERVQPVREKTNKAKPSAEASFYVLFTNKYWLILLAIMLLGWSVLGIFQGAGVYYADYILDDPNLVGPLNLFFTLPLLAGFFLTPLIIKKFGRRKTIASGLILLIVGSVLMTFDSQNLVIIFTGSLIRSIGFAPLLGSAYAMLADTIDYGEWKKGIRNDGLVYSGGTFSTVLGGGVASGGIGWLLGLAGYVSGNVSEQPDNVYSMIEFLFIYAPIIFSLFILLLLYFYNLDKLHPKISEDLRKMAVREGS
ncbi:MFS transporter [Bacillaceae bacterium SIJ1]|nr:MFS transporter [Litoribacterium kuwaitense]